MEYLGDRHAVDFTVLLLDILDVDILRVSVYHDDYGSVLYLFVVELSDVVECQIFSLLVPSLIRILGEAHLLNGIFVITALVSESNVIFSQLRHYGGFDIVAIRLELWHILDQIHINVYYSIYLVVLRSCGTYEPARFVHRIH